MNNLNGIGWKLMSDKKDHMVKYYSKKLTI